MKLEIKNDLTSLKASLGDSSTLNKVELNDQEITSGTVAYNEMADVPVQMIDPAAQVAKNLAHLEELQSRMRFMMKEIRYLLKV